MTVDKGIEYQQNLATLPVAILVVRAKSNRTHDLEPLVPALLDALRRIEPRALRKLAG